MKYVLLALVFWVYAAAYEVKIQTFDDRGDAVVGAKISVFFVKQGKSDEITGITGLDGTYIANGRSTLGVDIIAGCSGHYSSRVDNLKNGMSHDVKLILPRILNPIPLFAKDGFWTRIPSAGTWYGFDFEAADWVVPHGKGKRVDVLFRYTSNFRGWNDDVVDPLQREKMMAETKARDSRVKEEWSFEKFKGENGKWEGVLQVAFPGKEEGAVEQKFIEYSQMKMTHLAPVGGYLSTLEFSTNTYSSPQFRHDVGFFLRTRVQLDKAANIISANYCKIHEDIVFNPSNGEIHFTYYYNPVPNDRNLEFNPKDNLFREDKRGSAR